MEAIKLAEFAEKNGWIVVDQGKDDDGDSYIRYLTPSGGIVLVEFNKDGSQCDVTS